jgi:hypothetical protein
MAAPWRACIRAGPRKPSREAITCISRIHFSSQFLTDNIGNPHLEKHVVSAVTLMEISATYKAFKKHLDKVLPIPKAQVKRNRRRFKPFSESDGSDRRLENMNQIPPNRRSWHSENDRSRT